MLARPLRHRSHTSAPLASAGHNKALALRENAIWYISESAYRPRLPPPAGKYLPCRASAKKNQRFEPSRKEGSRERAQNWRFSMKLSVPIFVLKQKAKALSRSNDIPLHQALNQVANKEGFDSWSLLSKKARRENSATNGS